MPWTEIRVRLWLSLTFFHVDVRAKGSSDFNPEHFNPLYLPSCLLCEQISCMWNFEKYCILTGICLFRNAFWEVIRQSCFCAAHFFTSIFCFPSKIERLLIFKNNIVWSVKMPQSSILSLIFPQIIYLCCPCRIHVFFFWKSFSYQYKVRIVTFF